MKNILIPNILITVTGAMMMVTFAKMPQVNVWFSMIYFYFSIGYSMCLSILSSNSFIKKDNQRGLAFLISLLISFLPLLIFYVLNVLSNKGA